MKKTMTPMRFLVLILHMGILSLCTITVRAQSTTQNPMVNTMIQAAKMMKIDTIAKEVIEPCLYRAYYRSEYHPVAKSSSPSYEWMQLLQIGKTAQRYLDYGTWQADSIYDDGAKTKKAPEEFIPKYYKARNTSVVDDHILFLQTTGTMEFFSQLALDHFTYVDSLPEQSWTLVSGDSIVAGYTCHRAQTHYLGRHYTAWYTEEIPLSYGPYKFRGLPGLIVCIYDADRDHVFTLQGFERATPEEMIYRRVKSYFKTTRLQLLQASRHYMENPGGYNTPKIIAKGKKTPKPPKPYNPIELE